MRTLFLMAIALLAAACIPQTNALTGHDEDSRTTRIIIGFSTPAFDYQSPAFLETLSRDLAAEVTFLRPLSGNAALYLCKTKDSMESLASRLDKLSEYPDIEYAELDQKRTIQKKTY